jgi:hypothetical protein
MRNEEEGHVNKAFGTPCRSFVRKTRLFRMQYSYIDIVKELNGTLKHLVLGGSNGSHSTFLHDCE